MIVGPIANVLEDMPAGGEGSFADPVGAFGAHMGVALRGPIHALRHEMTADAGVGTGAVRNHRRSVVWTAGAEIGVCAPPSLRMTGELACADF